MFECKLGQSVRGSSKIIFFLIQTNFCAKTFRSRLIFRVYQRIFKMERFRKSVKHLLVALMNLKSHKKYDTMEIFWDPSLDPVCPLTYFQSLQLLHNMESNLEVIFSLTGDFEMKIMFQTAWEILSNFDISSSSFIYESNKLLQQPESAGQDDDNDDDSEETLEVNPNLLQLMGKILPDSRLNNKRYSQ